MRVDKAEHYSHSNFMKVIDHSTEVQASPRAIWSAVKTPAAFRKVTRGVIAMPAIQARGDEWRQGETAIEESGGLLRTWNHDIVVSSTSEERCMYRDRVEIDAGIFTPIVALYAHWFYLSRQRRWCALVKELSS